MVAQRQFQANVERTGLPFAPVDDPPADEWMPLMGQLAEMDLDTGRHSARSRTACRSW